MNAEDVAVLALGRAIEFSPKVPSARSVMYRRIGIRQQQLFIHAAKLNPDWAGVKANAPPVLWEGVLALDLADLTECASDLLTKIEISVPGTSAYVAGQEVNIVSLVDPDVADAPRVLVRNRVIQAYNNELAGVTSLDIFYSRVPHALAPTDAATVIELYDPHSELLVIDLTRHLLQKTIVLNPSERTAAIAVLEAEEKSLLGEFEEHVRRYSDATVARFGGSRFAPGAEQ